MASSIVVAPSGTNGMTSTAPMRGCSPVWLSMSISWTAISTSRSSASATGIVLAGDREDRPVVARVARPVEQEDAVARLDGLGHPVDDIETPALRHVRDGFDQHLTMLDRRRIVVGLSAHGPETLRASQISPGRDYRKRNATLWVLPSASPSTSTRHVPHQTLSTFRSNE